VKRTVLITSLVLLVVIVAFSVLLATRPQVNSATSTPSPLLGKLAPTFSAPELGGGTFSLAQDRGHVVVLNFWSSWCTPCKQEAPELSTYAYQAASQGVDVVGVVFNDTVSSATSFAHFYGSLYPSVVDTNGAIANSYGITAPPTTFIINAQGRVAATLIGATTAKQLTAVVDKVLQ